METSTDRIIGLARAQGVIRPRDLSALQIPTVVLTRMVRSLGEVAAKCPQGIVCLLSALRFHNVGTQAPFEVWLAIPNKARKPTLEYQSLRIVRFSGAALSDGVEEHLIDNVPVRITGIARTVADCFKFRNKIGMDVALEALHEAWKNKLATMDELWHFAEVDRITTVIRPYLESLV